MKVKKLIKKLEKMDQNAEVIMSMDSEGNCYNYLADIVEDMAYVEGEVYINKLTEEDIKEGFSDCDLGNLNDPDRVNCIVFYP